MKQNFTVRQGALDGVEASLSVAQHRSFRRAAAELGVTPSAISQAVRALEARVGAVLFMRTTRSVGLTEAGERFLARARPAFEELVAASGAARELGQRPVGRLRLTIPRSVVPILLEPLVASFCRAFPEIELELAASEELVDLAAEGFDAGIRLGDNGSSFGQARPPAVTTDGHRSHQFRTRNDRAKAQQTRSNSNESAVETG